MPRPLPSGGQRPYVQHARLASTRVWTAMTAGAIAFAGLAPGISAGATTVPAPQTVGLPAYFYPAGDNLAYWDQLRSGAPTVSVVIATGLRLETTSADGNYTNQIAKTRAAGIKVLAYVATTSGDKPLATAKLQIDRARAWYNVDGIFFDEAVRYPVTCEQVGYYQALNDYAKAANAGALTVINHGQILPECYASVSDVMMNAEMAAATYTSSWRPWGWEHNYPAAKFWHLVHSTPTIAEMQDVVRLSRERNAGVVFVTSAGTSSPGGPYGSLPAKDYWSATLTAVGAAVASPVPTTVLPSTTTAAPPPTTTLQQPLISSFSPVSGVPGSRVVITGTRLAGVSMVTLNGGPVAIVAKTATSLTVTLRPWSTSGKFWVNAPGGLSATSTGTFSVIR